LRRSTAPAIETATEPVGGVRNQSGYVSVRCDFKESIESLDLLLGEPQRQAIERFIPSAFSSTSYRSLNHSESGPDDPFDTQPVKGEPEQRSWFVVFHRPLKKPVIEQLQI
jgi:hypothetical protein